MKLDPNENASLPGRSDVADLVLATGGTGPTPRDLTPEAMGEVIIKELPGFGELMRRATLSQVPTAIRARPRG